jgi:class 3 adenylate cyclase
VVSNPDRPHRYVRSFDEPDDVVQLDTVRSEQVVIGGIHVSRDTQYPGWRWSNDVKPFVGTEWCEVRHVGYMIGGMQGVLLRDGTEFELRPGDVMDLPPGHDAWVIGDEPVVTIAWTGVKTWLGPLDSFLERVLATLVFTDIVDSTSLALRIGDRSWSDRMATLESRTRDLIGQHRGRLVKFTGDGTLASFDGAARAVRCAAALRTAANDVELPIRIAVHTGEVDLVDDDMRGVTIHEASRMLDHAAAGDILVSAVTAGLVSDSGFDLGDKGEVELRGISGPRRLFNVP